MECKSLMKEIGKGSGNLAQHVPETMEAFKKFVGAATADGALSHKTKELIAIALAVKAQCDGCIAHHAQAAVKSGISREEFAEALSVAILMGGGPASMYAGIAMNAYDEYAG